MCPMCPIWAHFRAQSWAQLVTIFSKYHRVWWYVICTTSTTKTTNSTKCGVVRFWENLWIYHNIWKVRYNETCTSCTSLRYILRYIVRYILRRGCLPSHITINHLNHLILRCLNFPSLLLLKRLIKWNRACSLDNLPVQWFLWDWQSF